MDGCLQAKGAKPLAWAKANVFRSQFLASVSSRSSIQGHCYTSLRIFSMVEVKAEENNLKRNLDNCN